MAETAFTLYDTYGFPLDLTADICRERNISVDEAGFDIAMEKQKAAARASGKFKMAAVLEYNGEKTRFVGYERLEETGTVVALYRDGTPVDRIEEGQSGVVVLDTTPFYAESGGQVGDVGVLAGQHMRFEVEDTQKIQADVAGHHGKVVNGTVSLGDKVDARVNMELRAQRCAITPLPI